MGMNQERQPLEPEARRLACIFAELIRLNDLVRLTIAAAHCSDGILDGPFAAEMSEYHEETCSLFRKFHSFWSAPVPMET